jgi:hypothetical protein
VATRGDHKHASCERQARSHRRSQLEQSHLNYVSPRGFELPDPRLLLGLLDNHTAGDAIARVAGRIVGEIVRFGVNH